MLPLRPTVSDSGPLPTGTRSALRIRISCALLELGLLALTALGLIVSGYFVFEPDVGSRLLTLPYASFVAPTL